MGQRLIPSILAFTALLAAPISAFSNAPHFDYLSQRASACANTADTQCQGVPDNFCCPSNSKCLILASNTTVLCCPTGSDCSLIQPIVCDVSQQNATAFPNAQIKTTNLTGTLPTCNEKCCPFGFVCTTSGVCALNPDQGTAPSHTSFPITASSTPTIAPASSSVASPSDSSSASASSSTSPPSSSSTSSPNIVPLPISTTCSAFPARAVVAGFFPGLALGALLAILTICLIGARRNKHPSSSSSKFRPNSNGSSTFGFPKTAASISDPIYHDNGAMRTDFIRKAPSTPTRQPTIQRVRSLFRKSAASTNAYPSDYQASPAPPVPLVPRPPQPQPQTPRTPRMQREPSGESINIFADPSTARSMDHDRDQLAVRASGQTTFTDMMERAELGGVRRGEGFVETPTPNHGGRWR